MPPKWLSLWLALLVTLSILSRERVRSERTARCSLDGVAIAALHRIDLMQDERVIASFCSLTCALSWPDVPPRAFWRLRDEVTGRPIDATLARFVASRVVSDAAHGERVHVFVDAAEAARHCDQFGGTELPNPFLHSPPERPRGAEK